MQPRSAPISAPRSVRLLARDARAQLRQDALGRLHTHVRRDEARLELLQDRRIDLAPLEEVGEISGEPGIAAVQTLAHTADETGTLVGARCTVLGCASEHSPGIVGQRRRAADRPRLRRSHRVSRVGYWTGASAETGSLRAGGQREGDGLGLHLRGRRRARGRIENGAVSSGGEVHVDMQGSGARRARSVHLGEPAREDQALRGRVRTTWSGHPAGVGWAMHSAGGGGVALPTTWIR